MTGHIGQPDYDPAAPIPADATTVACLHCDAELDQLKDILAHAQERAHHLYQFAAGGPVFECAPEALAAELDDTIVPRWPHLPPIPPRVPR